MTFIIFLTGLILVVAAIDVAYRSLARRRHRRLYGAAGNRADAKSPFMMS